MSDQIQTRMTASEFLELPETNTPVELIDGELVVSPAPLLIHQEILFRLALLLNTLAPQGKLYLAPVDVHLNDENVVQPDLVWLATDSQCGAVDGKYLHGAPELVVEVISPGSERQDRGKKFELYEKFGVHEYWLIDPVALYAEVQTRSDHRFVRQGVFGPDETFVSAVIGHQRIELNAILPH